MHARACGAGPVLQTRLWTRDTNREWRIPFYFVMWHGSGAVPFLFLGRHPAWDFLWVLLRHAAGGVPHFRVLVRLDPP